MNARSARKSSTMPTMPIDGHAEGEADGAGALDHVGVDDEALGLRVGDVVDGGALDAFVDAALVGGVVGHRVRAVVPVEVVLGEVEDDRGLGAHRLCVVELEAGQLDGEDVVGLGVHDRLDDRPTDVADRRTAQAGRAQDRVEHLHRGGLAVGAGDGQPGGGVLGIAQPPGELDLAPDRDAAGRGLREQGRGGLPARRGDEHVDVVGQRVGGSLLRVGRSRRGSRAARPSRPSRWCWSRRGRSRPRRGRAGCRRPRSRRRRSRRRPHARRPRGVPTQGVEVGRGHPMPATHSA